MMYHRACCCARETGGVPYFFAVRWSAQILEFITSPFIVLRQTIDYDAKTRIYRVDNGAVTWVGTRADIAPPNYQSVDGSGDSRIIDLPTIDRLDFNPQGLFLIRKLGHYESAGPPYTQSGYDHRIERIDMSDGTSAATYDRTFMYATLAAEDLTVNLCANQSHVFLLSAVINSPPTSLIWDRRDADLVAIDDGNFTGPFLDVLNPNRTRSESGGGIKDLRPVIDPDGNIRHYGLTLDKDDPDTVLDHAVGFGPYLTNEFFFRGGVIAIDSSTNLVGATARNSALSILRNGYMVENTGALLSNAVMPECTRGPSPAGSELLYYSQDTIEAYATYPPGGTATGRVLLWELEILPLLQAYVATLERDPIPADAILRIHTLCTNGAFAAIRVMGSWYTEDEDFRVTAWEFFAAEIERGFGPSATASVAWYIDSAFTPDGGVAIESPAIPSTPTVNDFIPGWNIIDALADSASGVGGSGVDYEYTPSA